MKRNKYKYGIVESRFRSFEQHENIICLCWSEADANAICYLMNKGDGEGTYMVINIDGIL